jgi:Flp pilus assembly protein TadG
MLLVFAVFVEVGLAFADKAVVADASRAAAREMVRDPSNQGAACQAADAVLASAILWGTEAYQCDCGGVCCAACQIDTSSGIDPGDPIRVSLSFPFTYRLIPAFLLGSLSSEFEIPGATTMRVLPN